MGIDASVSLQIKVAVSKNVCIQKHKIRVIDSNDPDLVFSYILQTAEELY